jgi:hypothetical protein
VGYSYKLAFLVVKLPSCVGTFPRVKGGIQVPAGLSPSMQTVESLLRTSWLAKPDRKIWQNVILLIHFKVKIHLTTYDLPNLAFV